MHMPYPPIIKLHIRLTKNVENLTDIFSYHLKRYNIIIIIGTHTYHFISFLVLLL